jgi:hypothetical protein
VAHTAERKIVAVLKHQSLTPMFPFHHMQPNFQHSKNSGDEVHNIMNGKHSLYIVNMTQGQGHR